jgi:hypothetical protein
MYGDAAKSTKDLAAVDLFVNHPQTLCRVGINVFFKCDQLQREHSDLAVYKHFIPTKIQTLTEFAANRSHSQSTNQSGAF